MRSSLLAVATLAILGFAAPALAQDAAPRILGAWNVTLTDPDGNPLAARELFFAGADANHGSVLLTTDVDLTPPLPCGPTTGSWERRGATYRTTLVQTCNNDGSAPDEPQLAHFTGWDTLTLRNGRLTGTSILQATDGDGNVLFQFPLAYAATRLAVASAPTLEPALVAARPRR